MQSLFRGWIVLTVSLLGFQGSAEASPLGIDELKKIAVEKRVWERRIWHKLLHYRNSFIWGTQSEADGKDFFLANEGKGDPEAEALASIEVLFSKKPDMKPAQKDEQPTPCRFPARRKWLAEALGVDLKDYPKLKCEKYDDYLNRHQAENVSLVFSSYYLGSAASTFGHTLLRINKKQKSKPRNELLDFGVNFGAEATFENPVLYALGGVVGWFNGSFTSVPYYYKVREYNDYESRDLWSYDLNLSQREIEILMDHLWELGSTYFDYFFFTENCSYHILAALEVVRPHLELTETLPYQAIPADTVKAVTAVPGLVRAIQYRPSVRTQFEYRIAQMSATELQTLKDVSNQKNTDLISRSDLDPQSKIRILDAAADLVEIEHPEDLLKPKAESSRWKQKLLIARSKVRVPSPELNLPTPKEERPDLGHDSSRFGIGGGASFADKTGGPLQGFLQTQIRFALHDFLDPSTGYPLNSQIEFLNVATRYYPNPRRFELEKISAVKVAALPPRRGFGGSSSINIHAGARRFYEENCSDRESCFGGVLEGGPGQTFSLFKGASLSLLLEGELSFAPEFRGSSWRIGVGPRAFLIHHFSSKLKGMIEGRYRYEGFSLEPHQYDTALEVRWAVSKRFSLGTRVQTQKVNTQWQSNVFYYY